MSDISEFLTAYIHECTVKTTVSYNASYSVELNSQNIVSGVELPFNRVASHFLLKPLKQKVFPDLLSAIDSLSLASP